MREKDGETIFKEIMPEKFLELIKVTNLWFQKAPGSFSQTK